MDVCLRVLKESNKSRFDSYSVRNSILRICHITFGIVACTFFPTTFLEIAVCASYCRLRKTIVNSILLTPYTILTLISPTAPNPN